MSDNNLSQEFNFLPQLFLQRLAKIIPEPLLTSCLQSFLVEHKTFFRVNTLKISTVELCDRLQKNFHLEPLNWHTEIFAVPNEQRRQLTESAEFAEGFFYIQNPSSVIPVLLLDPQPHEEILDLAAAPGGKTINMAIQMRNQGKIAAVEAVKSRFFRLKENLKKYGVQNTRTFLKDGAAVYRVCPERFDRVLLDAPCSSEARFNKFDPDSYAYWSERKINEMNRKQKKLLYSAFQSLKPGGVVVYSTCSFAPEENEMIIQYLLEKFPDAITIEEINLPFANYQQGIISWNEKNFCPEIAKAVRILPTEKTDAFFICKLKKRK